jgi:hypothetical protein
MFECFKVAGVQYLAVKHSNGWHVLDHDGNNYGAWGEVESFRKSLAGKPIIAGGMRAIVTVEPLGKCRLSVVPE